MLSWLHSKNEGIVVLRGLGPGSGNRTWVDKEIDKAFDEGATGIIITTFDGDNPRENWHDFLIDRGFKLIHSSFNPNYRSRRKNQIHLYFLTTPLV